VLIEIIGFILRVHLNKLLLDYFISLTYRHDRILHWFEINFDLDFFETSECTFKTIHLLLYLSFKLLLFSYNGFFYLFNVLLIVLLCCLPFGLHDFALGFE
jgi:hypothetical protein